MYAAARLFRTSGSALRRFWQDEEGASAVEYGLLAAILALGIYGAIQALGNSLTSAFTATSGKLDQAAGGGGH